MPGVNIKALLYRSRLFSLWHRVRNRNTLTVVMFHRILPLSSPQYKEADPVWTVSSAVFRDCLKFFAKEYAVISLDHLRRARLGEVALPKRALLITFDDGWRDNFDHALGILSSAGLPATVFVVAGLVKDRVVENIANVPKTLHDEHGTGGKRSCINAADEQLAQHMLLADELKTLSNSGCSIGSHGWSHTPVTQLTGREAQFRRARYYLGKLLSMPERDAATALSFPHGKYDSGSIRDAVNAGHDVLFTSDACLNENAESLDSRLLGRIHIPEHQITATAGRLKPELLAAWLFVRPRRTLRVS